MRNTYYRSRQGNRDFYNDDYSGILQIVVPEETTNLITNPSIEIDTTGFSAYNSTLSRDITYQKRGKYSLKVTPSTCTPGSFSAISTWVGALYEVHPSAGTSYTFSVDVKGQAGIPFLVMFWDIDYYPPLGQPTYFVANGRWQRIYTTHHQVSYVIGAYVSVFELIRQSTMCAPFYIDGLQLEAKTYPTTYCDGDMVGYVSGVNEYFWNGIPHESTSTRLRSTASGGKVINLFRDTNAKFINAVGLGLPNTTPLQDLSAYGAGGFYQRSNHSGRSFSITCDISRINDVDKRTDDLDLINLLSPKRVPAPQPLLFRFLEEANPQKRVYGDVGLMRALYSSGLEGDKSNPFIERLILAFSAIEPYKVMEGDNAAELPTVTSLSTVKRVIRRDQNGAWAKMPSAGADNGFDDRVYAIKRAPDGKIFFGGSFLTCNGVAVKRAVYWDGTSFTQLSTGFNGDVYDFEFDNDGNVYVVGAFTADGTGATTLNRIAVYDISADTLTAMGTGFDGNVYCAKIGGDGLLYVGGAFTTSGDTLDTLRHVAAWLPETGAWLDVGDDNLFGDVRAIVFGAMDRMYIGGQYPVIDIDSSYSGVAYTSILGIYGASTTDTWHMCGNSDDGTDIKSVYSMAVDDEGNIYAGETPYYDAAYHGTECYVKKWLPGGAWEQVGYAFYHATTPMINELIYGKYSKTRRGLIVSGIFTSVDNIPTYGGFAKYVGNKWCPLDVDIRSGGVSVDGITVYANNGELILSFDASSTVIAPVPMTTPLVVNGSGASMVKFTIQNEGVLKSIVNMTTGDELLFRDLNIIAGEGITIDLSDPNNITLNSDIQGDITGRVHPISDVGSFRLKRGDNYLSSFFYLSGGTTDEVIVEWKDIEINVIGEISHSCPPSVAIRGQYPPVPVVGIWRILMETGEYILTETDDELLME